MMMNRRELIRIGAATVGSLALRPFGLLPALAQNGPDYRALVCVFLFGGNDSNNTIVPMDDVNFQAYTSIRGSLALSAAQLTAPVTSVSGAPYAFHGKLPDVASLFASRELAVVANVGSLVQPVTRAQYQAQQAALPLNLVSHSDQQLQWQSSVAQGRSATGWGGRAADYIASQNINSSNFPTFFSVAGNTLEGAGANTQLVSLGPGQSLTLTGFNTTAASQAILSSLKSLLTLPSGASLVQAANDTMSAGIADANSLTTALAKATALKTVFPKTGIGEQLQQVAQVIQVQADLGMRRQIFFCSVGGFDTHTQELEDHNALYPLLSPALAAFYDATQELGMAQNVTNVYGIRFQPHIPADHRRRQAITPSGQPPPGDGRGGPGRSDLRQVPHIPAGRTRRYGHARALDPVHGDRSIWRDALLMVRDSGWRAANRVPEFCEFRVAEAWVSRLVA